MPSGGAAGGRAAEGIIAKAVKDLFRVGAKDAEHAAARDAMRAAERDAARRAERDAAQAGEQDAARAAERRALAGDPVDVASGTVLLHQVDVELPGMLALVLSRTHLSTYRDGRWFGRNWASTLDQRLAVSAGGVRFLAADGSVLSYPVGAGLPIAGDRMRLRLTGDTYTLSDRERTLHFGQPRAGLSPEWLLLAVTDRNGHRIDIERDTSGMPLRIKHSGGYEVTVLSSGGRIDGFLLGDTDLIRYGYTGGMLTEVINSSGHALRFSYDEDGRLTDWADRNDSTYHYEYDDRDRCVAGSSPGGQLNATFRYDDVARVTVVTDSLGNTTTYQLNELAQVVREVDPLGNATVSRWDAYDRLLARTDPLGRTTRYRYDADGNLLAFIRPDGSSTTATYNVFGQPLTVTEPDGGTWQRAYDRRGNLTAITDPAGVTTRYAHDSDGRLTAVTDPVGNVWQVHSDAAGLPVGGTDPMGNTTWYQRDAAGRITEYTDPAGAVTRYSWNPEGDLVQRIWPGGATDRWFYDAERNLTGYLDAAGRHTAIEIGPFDRPRAQTGPDGARLRFSYDTELRITAVTDPRGLTWQYEYDAAGRMVREVDYDGRALAYKYDAAGELAELLNGAGETVAYTRDRLGRVLEERVGGTATRFGYDPMGRLVHAIGPDAELRMELDPMGRVLTETCNGRTVTSAYDPLGRRVYRRTPSGAESRWEYQPDSRVAALHSGQHTVRFGYDRAGREVARRLGSAALLTHTYDPVGRVSGQVLTAGPALSRVTQRRSFRYHADGNLVGIDDALLGDRRFGLDAAGRISTVHGPQWTERYAYDAAGNLVTGAAYQQDAQGRVLVRTHAGQQWQYAWDAADRLTAVSTPDGQRWRYTYDPLGRRIAKRQLSAGGAVVSTVDFVWDGVTLAEQTVSGSTTTWDFEPSTFRPVTQTDERFYAIVTDLVGTPTELVDESGAVAWQRLGTVWGADPGAGTALCPLGFPGQYRDPESGLAYNYFRYYDPVGGRYQSPDPLGLSPAFNPFAYVHNPTTWDDPLGLMGCELPGRSGALNQAKRDLGIPRGQHPESVERLPLTDKWGNRILDENKQPIMTREYTYRRPNGDRVIIQDHGAGHSYGQDGVGDQGPHFNVRPPENTRTGKVPGTREHYEFRR